MNEMGNSMTKLERLPGRLATIGGVLLAVCIVGGMRNGGEFFRSYLVAFLFWIGITLYYAVGALYAFDLVAAVRRVTGGP